MKIRYQQEIHRLLDGKPALSKYELYSESGKFIHIATSNDEANARRLVACWNALDGISTEAIEAGVVKAAFNELKALEDVLSEMGEDVLNPYHLGEIRDILKKAEGRT